MRIEFEGFFGLALLQKSQERVDDHDAQDHGGVEPEADHQFDEAGGKQHVDENIVELGEKPRQQSALLALGQAVGTIAAQAPRGLVGG